MSGFSCTTLKLSHSALMSLDTRLTIYSAESVTAPSGAVSLTFSQRGEVFGSTVKSSVRTILTAAREAGSLEVVYKTRWSPEIVEGRWMSTAERPTKKLKIVRADEIDRRVGFFVYLSQHDVV